MARRGSEKRRLIAQVLVRLTEHQQLAVATHAERAQITIASWLRCLIADTLNVDAGPIVSSPAPEMILEIAHMREVVAELGGALVQAAIRTREDNRPVAHHDIEALITDVKRAVHDLDRLKEKLWPCQP